MPADITSMAYRGATPWHGLGEKIPTDASIEDCLKLARMTDTIQRRYLRMRIRLDSEETMVVPGYMAITRDRDNHIYQIASDRYLPMQYLEMVSMFREFVEDGRMTLETLGLLKNGAIAWAMCKTNGKFTLVGGDEIEANVLISTSHDGSLSNDARICYTRVVCRNTLALARSEAGLSFQFRHSRKDKKAAIKEAQEKLKLIPVRTARFQEWCNTLANAPVQDPQHVYQYLQQLTGRSVIETAIEVDTANETGSLLDSVIANTTGRVKPKKLTDEDLSRAGRAILSDIMDSPGSDLKSAKGTWWGVLNGVTRYYNFDAETRVGQGDTRTNARQDNRLVSSWYGVANDTQTKALELAMQYAKATA